MSKFVSKCLPPHVWDHAVTLAPAHVEKATRWANALADKIYRHRKSRGWYKTRNNPSAKTAPLEVLCRVGLLGEFGLREYLALPQPDTMTIGLDYFDGGNDITVGRYRVQVKAALNPDKYSDEKLPWLISAKANRVDTSKCDAVALTLPQSDGVTVKMIGFLMAQEWRDKVRPFPYDPDYANGVPGSELRPMSALYLSEIYPNRKEQTHAETE